jgi:GTP cyclohydrolase II
MTEDSSAHGGNGHSAENRAALPGKLSRAPEFSATEPKAYDENCGETDTGCVQLVAKVNLPTRFGDFTLYGFHDAAHDLEHTAVVRGDPSGARNCPVRVHSECHTGDVLGSLRCDCRDQLETALEYVGQRAVGAVIYLRQEGRGIGLLNKLKAYHLQELGLDTVEANEYLGYPAEARDYDIAARILELLGVESIALLSNNPDKIDKLRRAGVEVTRRIPIVTKPNQYNMKYLETKKHKMGHLL